MIDYNIPTLPLPFELENKEVLKQAMRANRSLAELKGLVHSIPNESILINTLTLQEAKDSSEVENIVTTQDDLYRFDLKVEKLENSPASKEVFKYREAIQVGFEEIKKHSLLTNNLIQKIQATLVGNTAGFRKVPGTELRNNKQEIIYRPPQDWLDVERHMTNLERFLNTPNLTDIDPLVRLAIIHHQFESIHPFYDGNGRTGRIICVLFLVANDLLDLPILYLSRYITKNKQEYYRLLQNVRDSGGAIVDWQAWILYMLKGIEETSNHTILIVSGIKELMYEYKKVLRFEFGKTYKHDLLNHLFYHPYTKIEHMSEAMHVKRITASKYLNRIVKLGLLTPEKIGRNKYYINTKLVNLLVNHQEICR
jgi:Fic family protein